MSGPLLALLSILLLSMSGQAFHAGSGADVAARRLENIEYARVNGQSLRLDAWLPGGVQAGPAVVIVHGGGWVGGSRREDVRPLFRPLEEAGIAWFSIDYRLVTDLTQFGVAIDDVASAIRFVKAHAAEYNVDPNRLALVGESAGGQLAAMAALRADATTCVRAVVALYTPADLASLLDNATLLPARIRDQVIGTPFAGLVRQALRQLSPLENVRSGMPPFLLIHGTRDPLVPFTQSVRLCERMRQVGASCEVYAVDGAGHGARWWESTPDYARGYKKKIVQWVGERLARVRT